MQDSSKDGSFWFLGLYYREMYLSKRLVSLLYGYDRTYIPVCPVHRWFVTRIPYNDRIRLAVEFRHRRDPFYTFRAMVHRNWLTFRIHENPTLRSICRS
jgi:hypothetical protein